MIKKLDATYHKLASYKYSVKNMTGNPHRRSIRALATMTEIMALYKRYRNSLSLYKSNFLDKTNSERDKIEHESFTYIRTDYNALILTIHRYIFYLIKVFDSFPNHLKKNIKTSSFSKFCHSIESEGSPLKDFYKESKEDIGILEYELALYRDLYLEHYDRMSTDWRSISLVQEIFFVRHIPEKRLTNNQVDEMRVFLTKEFGKEVFHITTSISKSIGFLVENRYRLSPEKRKIALTKYIQKAEYKSPQIDRVLEATISFTEKVVNLIECLNV